MLCVSLPEFPDYSIYPDGRVVNKKSGRERKPTLHKSGYYRVNLCHNGKAKHFTIHRLLATCFLPCNCDFKDITVDHINQNKTDNTLENLRWANRLVQCQNTGDFRSNTSGEKNIHFQKSKNKWVFQIIRNGIRHSKRFDTKEETIAYKLAFNPASPPCENTCKISAEQHY